MVTGAWCPEHWWKRDQWSTHETRPVPRFQCVRCDRWLQQMCVFAPTTFLLKTPPRVGTSSCSTGRLMRIWRWFAPWWIHRGSALNRRGLIWRSTPALWKRWPETLLRQGTTIAEAVTHSETTPRTTRRRPGRPRPWIAFRCPPLDTPVLSIARPRCFDVFPAEGLTDLPGLV